jgi:hypothetical protein
MADAANSTPGQRTLEGAVAGYRVVVRVRVVPPPEPFPSQAGVPEPPGVPDSDEQLRAILVERRKEFEKVLSNEAAQSLGRGFVVQVRDVSPARSIELLIVIVAVYKTIVEFNTIVDSLRKFAGTIEAALRSLLGFAGVQVEANWDEAAFAGPSPQTTDPEGGGAWQGLAPVLGAIATGIGVLGFVTFVGGAIEYARLDSAGLPGEEALAVIPTSNLVVIGASALVPAVIAALAATAAFYLWHHFSFTRVAKILPDPLLVSEATEGGQQTKAPPPPALPTRPLGLIVTIAVAEFVAFLLTHDGWGESQLLVVALLGSFTLMMSAVIAAQTNRIWLLGITAGLSVALFVGALAYARERDSSQVRPAAVIRQNQKASIGFFIAQTSDRVYLGRMVFTPDQRVPGGEPRMLVFSNDQITDVAVGPLMSPEHAYTQAVDLADELCDLQIPQQQTGAREKETSGAPPCP